MDDAACVRFLQWAMPQLRLRWSGFRKIRRQVCKRLRRRLQNLQLADLEAYRDYLRQQPGEWAVLAGFCRITISRFYRDRAVFDCLGREVLPALAEAAISQRSPAVRCWSAGCAAGEEPYSLALVWHLIVQPRCPATEIDIVATDLDPATIQRAERACYSGGSLKELPCGWLDRAFDRRDDRYCLRPDYRRGVRFSVQDIRQAPPAGPLHLVLCRNVAFTYFADDVQRAVLAAIRGRLLPGGVLAIGAHERLPPGAIGFDPWTPSLPLFRKTADHRRSTDRRPY